MFAARTGWFPVGGMRSIEYDDLSAKLRKADEQRLEFERSLDPLREKITKLQLEEQAAQLGGQQYLEQLAAAQVDLVRAAVPSLPEANIVVDVIVHAFSDQLELDVTIDDPGAFTKPFTLHFTAKHSKPGDELKEYICEENNQFGLAGGHANPYQNDPK